MTTRRERIEMAVAVPIGLAFAALLIHMCGCELDRTPPEPFTPRMPPCVPTFLSDGKVTLAACPDPRQIERTTAQDAGWCECPRVVSDDRTNEWGDFAGCGTEYVSRRADQTHGYERPIACDLGEDGGV